MYDIQTYSPNEVLLNIANYDVTGWNRIEVTRTAETFRVVRGIRGKSTRIGNKDSTCVLTIEVLQTSLANNVFSEIVRQDLISKTGRCQLVLRDTNGSTVLESENSFIKGYPSYDFTSDMGVRVWEIVCLDSTDFVVGSNAKAENSVLDLFESASSAIQRGVNLLGF